MKEFDIKILVSLKKTLNITKTADELFTTQPNITKHIQAMEREYGLSILIRKKTGIEFTPAGEYIANCARDVDHIFSRMSDSLEKYRSMEDSVITIGCPHSFSRFSLPDILSDFYQHHPNVKLNIETAHSSQLIPLLTAGKIDVAFIRGEIPYSGEKYLFAKDQVYLASRTPIDIKRLPLQPQIFYKKDSYSNHLIENWWNSTFDQPPNYILSVNDVETCRDMVIKGLGYGFFFLYQYLDYPQLFYRPVRYLDGSPLYRNTWICFPGTVRNNLEPFRKFILTRLGL